jgi:aldehyde dehydrogenase (NAD+)
MSERFAPDGCQHIAGKWVPAAAGETIAVSNPTTGEALGTVPRSRAADVDDAVAAAREAYRQWRRVSPTERGAILFRWAELCRAHAAELQMLECQEVGTPARGPFAPPDRITYIAGMADKLSGRGLPVTQESVLSVTVREPYGVCASIIPWNVPALQMAASAVPAIAAGNTAVVKPAEDAPLTCLALSFLAEQVGLPPGVLNVVTGYGPEAGAALASHPDIDHMSFTGSATTGAEVMRRCADHVTPVHLELGGKSPQILLADARLDRAIPAIVRSITSLAGQTCAAGSRVVVDARIHDEVVERIARGMEAVTVGRWDEQVNMGALINERQGEKVLRYIETGKAEGARLVLGGQRLGGAKYDKGFFVAPTLFDDVTPEMVIAQEEIFGPVLTVLRFESLAEAVELANSTKYGLVSAIWSEAAGSAIAVARQIEAGQVAINTTGAEGAIGAPFGGYKQSGFGRVRSAETILDYTQIKTITIAG